MGVLDYTGAIKITFDRPIINDPEILLAGGSASPINGGIAIASGATGGNPVLNAYDGATGSYWMSNYTASGQWIGRDYEIATYLDLLRVYMGYSSGRISAYEIQGSEDTITWNTVASGNFINSSIWQEVKFNPTGYRFWRLRGISKFSSYYTVSELEMRLSRNVYSAPGWTVTSQEYRYVPGGDLVTKTHTVRKVTKSADSMSVTLWLDMYSRMKAPVGQVTVAYDKTTGNLKGMGNIQVESFELEFTPSNITPVNNPLVSESLELSPTVTLGFQEVTYNYSQGEERITLTPSVTATLIHINDLEQ